MDTPIALPGKAANLDLVRDGGLSIMAVEAVDCLGVNVPDVFGTCNALMLALGMSSEVYVEYIPCTGQVDYIGLGPGVAGGAYQGTLTLISADRSTVYTIPVNGTTEIAVSVDGGVPTTTNLNWAGATDGGATDLKAFDEIYRAAMATFLPTVPAEPPGVTCDQSGACAVGDLVDLFAYFEIPALGFLMWPADPVNAPNAINRIDLYAP
jgi:hypothetical protein